MKSSPPATKQDLLGWSEAEKTGVGASNDLIGSILNNKLNALNVPNSSASRFSKTRNQHLGFTSLLEQFSTEHWKELSKYFGFGFGFSFNTLWDWLSSVILLLSWFGFAFMKLNNWKQLLLDTTELVKSQDITQTFLKNRLRTLNTLESTGI